MVVRVASIQVLGVSRYFYRALALCVAGALVSISIPLNSLAQSVSYFGRDFTVDKLEQVDGDQLSIEVDKRSFLVRSSNAGRRVFQIYAGKPELFSPETLNTAYGSFIASLAAEGDEESAAMAIRGVLSSQHMTDEQKDSVFAGIVASPEGEVTLRTEILDAQGEARRGSCLALRSLDRDDRSTIKKLLTSDAQWIVQQCPRILIASAQAFLRSGDRTSGASMFEFVGDFFAGSESGIAQAATTSYERLKSLQRAIDSGTGDQFESEVRVASFDALLGECYQELKSKLVIEFCERSLIQQQPIAVVQAMTLVDFSQRNSKHHELLVRAVGGLRCQELGILQGAAIKKMLLAYASKDEAVKQRYLSLLSSCIEESAQSDDASRGMAYVVLLTEVRPDPCTDNDILRSALAESFFDRGDIAGAYKVLGGVGTELPWVYRFRLLLKSDAYVLGMVLLGLLVVVRWILMLGGVAQRSFVARSSASSDRARVQQRDTNNQGESEDSRRAQFFDSSLKKQMYRGLDEYRDCLSTLQLEPGASVADIKNAYRHLVKALHPDMNPHAAKEDTNKFIELTKTYERLLALHEAREKGS